MGDAGFDVTAARAAFPALNQKQVFMDVCDVSKDEQISRKHTSLNRANKETERWRRPSLGIRRQ